MEAQVARIETDIKCLKESLTTLHSDIRDLRSELKGAREFSLWIDKVVSLNQAELKGEIAIVRVRAEHQSSAVNDDIDAVCESVRSAHARIRDLQHGAGRFGQDIRRLEERVSGLK